MAALSSSVDQSHDPTPLGLRAEAPRIDLD